MSFFEYLLYRFFDGGILCLCNAWLKEGFKLA
jgi:hypothetical protein